LAKYVKVENDISQWDDQTGVLYHFPKRYKSDLLPNTEVVYYKGYLKNKKFAGDRLSELPHYFGVAKIGKVFPDRNSTKGDLFATIEDYKVFSEPVIAKQGNAFLEQIPESKKSNYWRDGVRVISDNVFTQIIQLAQGISDVQTKRPENFNDVDAALVSGEEGKKTKKYVTVYERDPKLRDAAIAIHGLSCVVCKFNFGQFYGEYAEGYIHIHHLTPVAELSQPTEVNPQTDLIPVCANCHSIIHRRKNKTLSIDELRKMIKG